MLRSLFHTKWGKRVTALGVAVILGGGATTAFAYLVAPSGGSTPLVAAGQVQSQPTQNVSFAITSDTYTQGAGAGFTKIGDQETIYLKATNNGTLTTELNQVSLAPWSSSAGATCDAAAGAGTFTASPDVVSLAMNAGQIDTLASPLVITMVDTGNNQSCLEGATITFVVSAS